MRRLIRFFFFGMLSLAAVGIAGLAWMFNVRPGLDRYEAHLLPIGLVGPGLHAAWYGTTAVLLSDGKSSLFIDPFFTRPGGWPELIRNRPIAPDETLIQQWLEKSGISQLDAVIVSHSHYDHSMDAGVVARLTGARLLGSESTANVGRGSGLPEHRIRVLSAGEKTIMGEFTITLIESRHAGATGGRPLGDITEPLVPPARYTQYRQGGSFAVLVEHPLGNVLHHGSAGWLPGMMGSSKADIVFLGIAAISDINEYLAEVVDAAGATRVIPTHWDDFTRPLDLPLLPLPYGVDLDGFFEDTGRLRPGIKLQTLRPGQVALLYPSAVTPP